MPPRNNPKPTAAVELTVRLRADLKRNIENVPKTLRNQMAWLVWKAESIKANGKFSKVPYYASGWKRSGELGSDKDMEQLVSFDEAYAAFNRDTSNAGVGIALVGGVVAFDADACISSDGTIDADVKALVADTYAEVSPSGKGVRAFWFGDEVENTVRPGRELYSSKRFMTVTGNQIENTFAIFGDELDQKRHTFAGKTRAAVIAACTKSRATDAGGIKTAAAGQPPGDWDAIASASAHDAQQHIYKECLPEVLDVLAGDGCSAIKTYDGWLTVGMAIHEIYGGTDEGLRVWDDWSKRFPEKYETDQTAPASCTAKWETFGKTNGERVAAGTLFRMAKEAGWNDTKLRNLQLEQFKRVGSRGADYLPVPQELSVEDMLERFVFLSDGSFVLDRENPQNVWSLADFRNLTASNVTILADSDDGAESCDGNEGEDSASAPVRKKGRKGKPKEEKPRAVLNAELWKKHPKRKTAYNRTFRAGGNEFILGDDGSDLYNTWRGFPAGSVAPGDPTIFVEHVRWLFGDRADEFLDWLAHTFQKPGELPHTCWLHISHHPGTGRNWLAGALAMALAGYAALSIDLPKLLESNFNEVLARKLLCVVDEIREGGQGSAKWRHASRLDSLLVQSSLAINPKYGRMYLVQNAARWLMFSNYVSAIPIKDNDRRFQVAISDQRPLDPDYYVRLYAALEDRACIAGIRHLLQNRDISRFNPGARAAKSDAKLQVIGATRSTMATAIAEFTEAYPFDLVTAARLQAVAGINAFGKDFKEFAHVVEDAGWRPIGRFRLRPSAEKLTLYARVEVAVSWKERGYGHADHIPKCDGGKAKWGPDSDGDDGGKGGDDEKYDALQ